MLRYRNTIRRPPCLLKMPSGFRLAKTFRPRGYRKLSSDHITTISDKPVLIVGAGPTGLIVGIELARRGVPFHLIDRMASPAPWSAAIFIKSRSLEILAALGLIDDFIERGQIVDGVDVYLAENHVG